MTLPIKNPEFEEGKFYKCLKPDVTGDGQVGTIYTCIGKSIRMATFRTDYGDKVTCWTKHQDLTLSALFVEVEDPKEQPKENPNQAIMDRDLEGMKEVHRKSEMAPKVYHHEPITDLTFGFNQKTLNENARIWKRHKRK